MTDYKSRELNIFSADAKNKLRVVSESHAVLESDVFKFKYGLASQDGKGDVTGNMPIYIPKLAADVGGTAVYISDWLWQDRQTIAAEQSRAIAAESVLRSDTKTKFDTNALAISRRHQTLARYCYRNLSTTARRQPTYNCTCIRTKRP